MTNSHDLGAANGTIGTGSAGMLADESTGTWILIGQPSETASTQQIALRTQPFKIGRHPDNQLTLNNPSVSGHHAEFVLVESEVFVRDLDSTNGTLLNGRPLTTLTGLRDGDILHFGSAMFTLQRTHQQVTTDTITTDSADDALAHVQFDKLIGNPAVRPFFQPIVRLADQRPIAFEALSRSQLIGLETPAKMFRVAVQRTAAAELSAVCRSVALHAARSLDPSMVYYLNTHPIELKDEALFDSLRKLREANPTVPVMLEVHESGVTSPDYLRKLRAVLTELNMQLAYDDFGAGQARLMELVEVPPEVLKFDIKMIRGLPSATAQQRNAIGSLVGIVRDLGVVALAEGVETADEAAACHELGFELAQGYFFGRPKSTRAWIGESQSDIK